jgi:YVTN family beta-propeller protein
VPSAGYYGGGGSIAVTNGGSHTVSLFGYPLHGPPAVVWDVVAVGTAPGAVVFDPVYDVIAVANGIDNNVTVISVGTSVYTYANVPVGNDPYAIAFSPATLELYVTNVGSANVTVIDANGHQWGSISVGNQPHGIAYDPKTTQLYVTNFGDHSISVIGVKNTVVKTLHLPVGSEPIGIDYNSVYEVMEVTGWLSDKVYVVP